MQGVVGEPPQPEAEAIPVSATAPHCCPPVLATGASVSTAVLAHKRIASLEISSSRRRLARLPDRRGDRSG